MFGNPTFQAFDCAKLKFGSEYDLCIFVDFADRSDDVLLLNKDHGEETVFIGTLMKEKTVVSVIFEDDDEIEVRFKKNCVPCQVDIIKIAMYTFGCNIVRFNMLGRNGKPTF